MYNDYLVEFDKLGKKIKFDIKKDETKETPEYKEKEIQNYILNDKYYKKLENLCKKYKALGNIIETKGQGLKGLKQTKTRLNKTKQKNNNCLIGGRILTLNELDQIIDRIKKQK